MKGSIDWLDVAIHSGVATAIMVPTAIWLGPWATIPVGTATSGFFYFREAWQREPDEYRPWKWGKGSLMEAVGPFVICAIVVAVRFVVGGQ